MTSISAPSIGNDLRAARTGNGQALQPVANDEIGSKLTLAIANRFRQERHHARVALHSRCKAKVVGADADAMDQVGENSEFDPCFTKRRQHLFDVAEEKSVRADDKNALTFERKTMGVKQIRSAMQRNNGLACSWSALNNKHARKWCTNDFVLLTLNRRDNVTESTGTRRF